MDNSFYIDDADHISLEAMKVIEEKLIPYGIKLTLEQEDAIFVPINKVLEGLSNGEYKSHL